MTSIRLSARQETTVGAAQKSAYRAPLDANALLKAAVSEEGGLQLHGFEDSSDALASADTHADERVLPSHAPQFIQCLHRQDAARRPNRMTKRNAAAVRVRAIQRQVQVLYDRQRLSRKGLIQLDHVHILDGQAGLLQYL